MKCEVLTPITTDDEVKESETFESIMSVSSLGEKDSRNKLCCNIIGMLMNSTLLTTDRAPRCFHVAHCRVERAVASSAHPPPLHANGSPQYLPNYLSCTPLQTQERIRYTLPPSGYRCRSELQMLAASILGGR
jgi:hypothetical protein